MKNFLEKLFPVIREGKTKIYILCGLLCIFVLVYERGKEELAIIVTLAALLPIATLQGLRDDYLRYPQRKDPENGRKSLVQFIIWSVRHTIIGSEAFLSSLIYVCLFLYLVAEKFDLIN